MYHLSLAYQYTPVSSGIDMNLLRRSADLGSTKAQLLWASVYDMSMNDPGTKTADNDALVARWRKAAADHTCPGAYSPL